MWPDLPPTNLWLKDPEGYVIQLTPGDKGPVPGAGVGAVLVEPANGAKRQPPFAAKAIAALTIPVANPDASAAYYRKLLGDNAAGSQSYRFRTGHSELVLGLRDTSVRIRIAIAGFDAAAAEAKLRALGIQATVLADKSAVVFDDLDGIAVEIGA